ncbi:MAG: hypothetical protein WC620_06150 [Methanoregula sp.]|jgi:hypothetical protein
MTGADLIQMLSICIEIIIAAGAVAVFIAVKKQKWFGWAIAATFGLYVIFDLSRMEIFRSLPGWMRSCSLLQISRCSSRCG